MKIIQLYTDGACSGNPGPGGWGAILVYNNNEKELSGGEKMTTNNRMELLAVIRGLEAIKEPCAVYVTTDSKYVTEAINQGWLKNWIKKDFKDRKNDDLWRQLIPFITKHNVYFTWIKGHSGHHYNERCDKLAVVQRDRYK